MNFNFSETYHVDVCGNELGDIDIQVRTSNNAGCYYPAMDLESLGARLTEIIRNDICHSIEEFEIKNDRYQKAVIRQAVAEYKEKKKRIEQ